MAPVFIMTGGETGVLKTGGRQQYSSFFLTNEVYNNFIATLLRDLGGCLCSGFCHLVAFVLTFISLSLTSWQGPRLSLYKLSVSVSLSLCSAFHSFLDL